MTDLGIGSDQFDDELDMAEEILDESEQALQRLESRLDQVREPKKKGNKQFARGIALVLSLGFVLAGCLIAGLTAGEYLAQRTGYPIFQLLGALFGLLIAFVSGAKLLKPIMNSEN